MCGRTKIIASAQIFRPQSILPLPLPLPHLLTLLTKFVKINQGNIILIFIGLEMTFHFILLFPRNVLVLMIVLIIGFELILQVKLMKGGMETRCHK